jgi:hypothetical protein
MREIADILLFRTDISPFLAHLTRIRDGISAADRLTQILDQRRLLPGPTQVSDARFGGNTVEMTDDAKRRWFGAVSFTETPIGEAHCLLEIAGRVVNLEPYGLVFLKDRLKARNVAPVLYINNEDGTADPIFYGLFSLIATQPAAAERLLPLVSVFGQKVKPPGAVARPAGRVDFTWEREWRHPAALGAFAFAWDDVFCGFCPHDEIGHFQGKYAPIRFIDPRRNMKWYAKSLIESRQRLNLKYSVV